MRSWLIIAATSGFLAVLIGAMGAHSLKPFMTEEGLLNFQTANQYHMWHSLVLLGIGFFGSTTNAEQYNKNYLNYASASFLVGIILFSGNLYWIALDDSYSLHFLIPVGGLFFLIGWFLVGFSFLKSR